MPILTNSRSESKKIEDLLGKSVPSYRKAYSDRTAWLMACFSELAYIKFNPFVVDANHKNYYVKLVSKLAGEKKATSFNELVDLFAYDHSKAKKKLLAELSTLKFDIVETFNEKGTQAILASNAQYLVLAFRGTEANSPKDIKADAKAKTMQCETEGKIHSGFNEAFKEVALAIQNALDREEFNNTPLFITGHSLGGALATVAAKKLTHAGGIAACYTFGSPRVGDDKWVARIKVPVYRLVNSADCVTMLPPSDELIEFFRLIAKFCIPHLGKSIRAFLSQFTGYIHAGNMRYLTDCSAGKYADVELLYSASFLRRIKGFLAKKWPWRKFLADHSISIYRKKLMLIAERRNKG